MPADALDIARGLDPAWVATDAGIALDPWQDGFVLSNAAQIITLCPRQCGKTESAVIKSISVCLDEAESLAIIVSPSQRQSNEFIRRAKKIYAKLCGLPKLLSDAAQSIEFPNHSRIIACPGDNDGDTLRGLANVRLAIVDETSRCSNDLITAVRPMLATNRRAQLIYLSTPAGKQGVFYETWISKDQDWQRIKIEVKDCPRITSEWLARERKNLGETKYAQEYLLQFIDNEAAAFSTDLIDSMFTDRIKPLFNGSVWRKQ